MTWLSTGSKADTLLVPGGNVLEIEIEPNQTSSAQPETSLGDPAIVSYSKTTARPSDPPPASLPVNGQPLIDPTEGVPSNVSPTKASAPPSPTPVKTTVSKENEVHDIATNPEDISASATLNGPFNDLSLNEPGQAEPVPEKFTFNSPIPSDGLGFQETAAAPVFKARGKRGGKNQRRKGGMISTPTQASLPASFSAQQHNSISKKRSRQTPIPEEPAMSDTRLSRAHRSLTTQGPILTPGVLRQNKPSPDPTKGKRRRYKEEEDQNGWATGEATDIQDMGDFDFEENHKKFDKRKIFEQIRKDDTTANEARLVSVNRLPSNRSGTAGGKNLHYSENVLDSPVQKKVNHSSGESEVEISEARISSGRSVSRASALRNTPSRKASILTRTSFERVASPKPRTNSSTSFRKTSTTSQSKPSLFLRIINVQCPAISPLQMLELEQLSTAEFGLTEDMMTENAARSIAQTVYGRTADVEMSAPPSALVVVLAGNHKTGSRAIAAARHLCNHHTRVLLCLLGLEREDNLLDSVRRQLHLYRACGGQAVKQDALTRTLRQQHHTPIDMIVDGLFGVHLSFDDLRGDDQATYFELVSWANASDAEILSLDIPSGVDASTGAATVYDSTQLVMVAGHVFSLVAPKTGLLNWLAGLRNEDAIPDLAVADVGIPSVAWRKAGMRRRHGVEFSGAWVAGLRFEEGREV